jgi:hypothetical protein
VTAEKIALFVYIELERLAADEVYPEVTRQSGHRRQELIFYQRDR